jgi:hypothetical protein
MTSVKLTASSSGSTPLLFHRATREYWTSLLASICAPKNREIEASAKPLALHSSTALAITTFSRCESSIAV